METRTFESIVSIDEEMAKASLQGTIDSLTREGNVEIVSLEAREIEGVGWVATLVVRMLDPEPEPEDEEEGRGETGRGERRMPDEEDENVLIWHGSIGRNAQMEASPAGSIPDMGDTPDRIEPDIERQVEGPGEEGYLPHTYGYFAEAEPPQQQPQAPEPEPSMTQEIEQEARDEIRDAAQESVESLSEEFQEAEENNDTALATYEAEQARLAEEAREEEERRRLAELAAQNATQGPRPDPAQSS